jgi:hypothetical protein
MSVMPEILNPASSAFNPLRAGLDSGLQHAGMTTKECLDYYETFNNCSTDFFPNGSQGKYRLPEVFRSFSRAAILAEDKRSPWIYPSLSSIITMEITFIPASGR